MGQSHLRALLLAILIGVSLNSFAETPPPARPSITWKASMKRQPSTILQMGALRVRFERTTLNDVRSAASVGEIAHQGEAGESIYWLCYTNLSATQVERIWIIADGEMGGPEHYVTSISAEILPDASVSGDCPELPNKLKPLSLDQHLWLGASESGATAKLGTPSYRKGTWKSYDFEGKVPGNCSGGHLDLLAWLFLHFENGHADSLQVGQVTSC
jgi:hypothetical protein